MIKPLVLITRRIPAEKLTQLQQFFEVDIWDEELPPPRAELLMRIQGKDGLMSLLTDKIDGEAMDAAGPQLKVISNIAVGFDNIDMQEATRRGIAVGNTPEVLTDTTADFAFALLLAAGRRVVESDHYTRSGKWKTWGLTQLLGQDLTRATLGIIGFGRIGRGMAKRAQGFDMRVLFYDPYAQANDITNQLNAQPVDLKTLFRQSDFISIHTPLNENTYHLINQQAFAQMKQTAVLVNTSRGPVVDPDALYQALNSRQISFAALDVTEPEPIPLDHPLLSLDNLIVTPHIASASVTTRNQMISMAINNLLAGLRKEKLPYCANPEVYS